MCVCSGTLHNFHKYKTHMCGVCWVGLMRARPHPHTHHQPKHIKQMCKKIWPRHWWVDWWVWWPLILMRFYSINSGGGITHDQPRASAGCPSRSTIYTRQLLHFDGTFLHNVLGECAAMMMAMFDGIKCIIIWTLAPSSHLQSTHHYFNDSELQWRCYWKCASDAKGENLHWLKNTNLSFNEIYTFKFLSFNQILMQFKRQ